MSDNFLRQRKPEHNVAEEAKQSAQHAYEHQQHQQHYQHPHQEHAAPTYSGATNGYNNAGHAFIIHDDDQPSQHQHYQHQQHHQQGYSSQTGPSYNSQPSYGQSNSGFSSGFADAPTQTGNIPHDVKLNAQQGFQEQYQRTVNDFPGSNSGYSNSYGSSSGPSHSGPNYSSHSSNTGPSHSTGYSNSGSGSAFSGFSGFADAPTQTGSVPRDVKVNAQQGFQEGFQRTAHNDTYGSSSAYGSSGPTHSGAQYTGTQYAGTQHTEKHAGHTATGYGHELRDPSVSPFDNELKPDYVLVFAGRPEQTTVRVSKALAVLSDEGFYVAARRGAANSVLVLVRLKEKLAVKETFVPRSQVAYDLLPWAKLVGVTDSYPVHFDSPKLVGAGLTANFVSVSQIEQLYDQKTAGLYKLSTILAHGLVLLSVLGLYHHLTGNSYSLVYTAITLVWGTLTAVWWRKSVATGIHGALASRVEPVPDRPQYRGTSRLTRERRRLLFIPIGFALIALCTLGQTAVLGIEVFFTQMYAGPFHQLAAVVPIGAGIVASIVFHIVNDKVVSLYSSWEDYPTQAEYRSAKVQRNFYLNLLLAFLPIALTAYLYLPFGNLIIGWYPHFQVGYIGRRVPLHAFFKLNTGRLQNQASFFAWQQPVINILVGLLKAPVVSFVNTKILKALNASNTNRFSREQLLRPFDTDEELEALTIFFGYILVLSPVWPLATLTLLAVLTVRAKFGLKILSTRSRKPQPADVKTLAAWSHNLNVVLVLASVLAPSIAVMYGPWNENRVLNGSPLHFYYDYKTSVVTVSWGTVVAAAFFTENLVLGLYHAVWSYYEAAGLGHFLPSAESVKIAKRANAEDPAQERLWRSIDVVQNLNDVYGRKLL